MSIVVPRPLASAAPRDAREPGYAPFWPAGHVIRWHYRRPGWQEGEPSNIVPLTVVRDDERGLVAWLAAGTEQEITVAEDGSELHSLPLEEMWLRPRVGLRTPWRGNGILRIAPVGVPWSVWLFWSPGDADADGLEWRFAGWYVNLENAHLRSGDITISSDHILDIDIDADGIIRKKDEDELEAGVAQGRVSEAEAAQITANAEEAIASFRAGDWPFAEEWQEWRPDSDWTVPAL